MTNLTKYSTTIYKEQILELLGVKGEAYITSVKWDADAEELDINVVGEKADKTFKIGDNWALNVNGGEFNNSVAESESFANSVINKLTKYATKDSDYLSDEKNINIPFAADLAKESNDLFMKNNKDFILNIVSNIEKAKAEGLRNVKVALNNLDERKTLSEIFKTKGYKTEFTGVFGDEYAVTISW